MNTDDNAQKYFRFSDNGRIFMITDVDSSSLSQSITNSFNNAVKFFQIVLSALKQDNKSSFDYLAIQKIFNSRKETILNKQEFKSIRPESGDAYKKLNEVIIDFATDHLPIKDSNLTIAKNILSSIWTEMYRAYVYNKSNEKIAYPILYLESYGGIAIMSFKIYYIQSIEIEKLKDYDGTNNVEYYHDCEYYAYRGNFDYSIDVFDFINTEIKAEININSFINPIKF